MINAYSIPGLVDNIEHKTEQGKLTLSLGHKVLKCTAEQAAVWALCNGLSMLSQIAKRLESMPSINLGPANFDDICALYKQMQDQGWMTISQREPIQYPVPIKNYDQIVACRNGIFAVNRNGYKRLAYGMYFGVSFDSNNDLLAYEFPHLDSSLWHRPFSDAKSAQTNEGLIRRFQFKNGVCNKPDIAHKNLPNNVHHIVTDGADLYAVDTQGQVVIRLADKQRTQMSVRFKQEGYCHINSLKKVGDHWLLMRSVSGAGSVDSGVLVLDKDWQSVKEMELPAQRAHDIYTPVAADPQEVAFWYCDSNNGHIGHYPSAQRTPIKSPFLENNTTRGFSEHENCWVVGSGVFGRYYWRESEKAYRGMVSYINKQSGQSEADIRLPESPCCIVPIKA